MTKQQLLRLAGAFAIAVLLWVVLAVVRRPPNDRPARLALGKVDTGSVDTIAIGKTLLVRSAGSWRANGYPAAPDAVSEMLKGLADTSAWTELVAESKTSHERLGVAADSGQSLRVAGHGRTQLDLITGKRTQDYRGVYVRRPNEDAVYALHGGIASSTSKNPDDWRDKKIVAVVPESVTTVTLQRGTQSRTLRRGVGDTTKLNTLLGSFRDVRAAGFATPAQADSANFNRTPRRVRLQSKSGATLADLRFDSTASGVWVRADSSATVFRVEPWMLGQLLPAK